MAVPPPLLPPRFEGALRLPSGRRLGYAEFGPAAGRPLLWFHGTPGARRQIAPRARELAHERDLRIVSVERPGVGESTPHVYRAVVDFARDIQRLCDALEIDRFGVVGLSGGGPYALACAHELPARVVAAVVLGGVAPTVGPDAASGGSSELMRTFAPLLSGLRRPLGGLLKGLVHVLEPVGGTAADLFARTMPPGDRRLLEDPSVKRMFLDDLILGGRRCMQAILLDAALFGRAWGFALANIGVPVHLFYGDADVIVPLPHGEHLASRIPGSRLLVRPGEGHLGGLGASDEVFDAVLGHWPAEPSARPPAPRSPSGGRKPRRNNGAAVVD